MHNVCMGRISHTLIIFIFELSHPGSQQQQGSAATSESEPQAETALDSNTIALASALASSLASDVGKLAKKEGQTEPQETEGQCLLTYQRSVSMRVISERCHLHLI